MYFPRFKHLVNGLASFVRTPTLSGTGGTDDPDYCYSVWLRHFVLAQEHGLKMPSNVAELGPGDSLGAGIAALLCGAKKYTALDIADYGAINRNLPVFYALVDKFKARKAIPSNAVFPRLFPELSIYEFPKSLTETEFVTASHLAQIESSLSLAQSDNSLIKTISNWDNADGIECGTIDFVFSHAVMFYVDDLLDAYSKLFQWLKPGGLMAHQIDFSCLYFHRDWYAHWCMPELIWRCLKGQRHYFLNRAPLSAHLYAMRVAGFCVESVKPTVAETICPRASLADKFRHLSDEDLNTKGAYILAKKPI